MDKQYPFKLLDAYTSEDTDIFFGREEEVQILYEMTFQTNIVLVYGASGTGKTSLIQCGLASQFQSHNWLPLYIRRGQNINESLEKALEEAGKADTSSSEEWKWMEEDLQAIEGEAVLAAPQTKLEDLFSAIYLKHFRPIYLIFDQFEELYVLGNAEEQQTFIETVREILQITQPVKMIFSIREEYLGHLYEFEKMVPQLLSKKLRVEPMNLGRVKNVIIGATSYEKSNVKLREGEEEAIAEGIFEIIRGDDKKRLSVALPYLQVFLDKFYLSITHDENRKAEALFTISDLNAMGTIGDVLKDFLEEQVSQVSRKLKAKYSEEATLENVWNLLSPFATLEGTKEPIAVHDLEERFSRLDNRFIKDTVDSLVNRRILRYSEDEDLYEVAHDSLAQRIAEKRSDEEIALLEIRRLIKSQTDLKAEAREFFTEKQLNFIEAGLEKLRLYNLIDEEGEALVRKSQEKIAREKAAAKARRQKELDDAQARAEKERRLREKAEENALRAQQRTRVAILVAAVALLTSAAAIFFYLEAQRERTNAVNQYEALVRTQRKARAREISNYANNYFDLGQLEYACENWRTALDSLRYYPDDDLYAEIERKIELRCN